jgi:hypothetical protein
LNAVSRFDTNRQKRWSGLPRAAQWALYAVAGVVAAAAIFQLFFRYQYLEAQGALWRVDRLTQQTCQVTIGQAHCSGAKLMTAPTTSTSTSTSISTSPSLTLKTPASRSKPH